MRRSRPFTASTGSRSMSASDRGCSTRPCRSTATRCLPRAAAETSRRSALADLREAADLSVGHGVPVAGPFLIGFLAHALLEQGDAVEADRVIAQAAVPQEASGSVQLAWFSLARGRVRIETGRAELGVEELLRVGETMRRVAYDQPSSIPWRSWAVEGLRLLHRDDEARAGPPGARACPYVGRAARDRRGPAGARTRRGQAGRGATPARDRGAPPQRRVSQARHPLSGSA